MNYKFKTVNKLNGLGVAAELTRVLAENPDLPVVGVGFAIDTDTAFGQVSIDLDAILNVALIDENGTDILEQAGENYDGFGIWFKCDEGTLQNELAKMLSESEAVQIMKVIEPYWEKCIKVSVG